MDDLILYHNPRCSKSREALRLLREEGCEPRIVEYLKTPPDAAELERILGLLGMGPHDLVRTEEDVYEELRLSPSVPPAEMIWAMVENPILLERPIAVRGERARLGRPPERVLALLDQDE